MAFDWSAFDSAFDISQIIRWSSLGVQATDDVVLDAGRTFVLDVPGICRSLRVSGNLLVEAPSLEISGQSFGLWIDGGIGWGAAGSIPFDLHIFGVNESRFVGSSIGPIHPGGVIDTDPGIWVTGHARWQLNGRPKVPWGEAGTLSAGANRVVLPFDPLGWEIGDELMIAPTVPPSVPQWYNASDIVRVADISGRTVVFDRTLQYDHPSVNIRMWDGSTRVLSAEIVNLTRSVILRGAPNQRPHFMFMGHTHDGVITAWPQYIGNVDIRHFGPMRRDAQGNLTSILGRYGLHFHMGENGFAGSVVEGVVVRDPGGHAFVAHQSHGVTFAGTVADQRFDDPYWWDIFIHLPPDNSSYKPPTNDVLYDSCIASRTHHDPDFRSVRSDFLFAQGQRMKASGCRSFGGNRVESSYNWPEGASGTDDTAPDLGVWDFGQTGEENISHNMRLSAVDTWQNTGLDHRVERFLAYHNGRGVDRHGAYGNAYLYGRATIHGAQRHAFLVSARAGILDSRSLVGVKPGWTPRHDTLVFQDLVIDGAEITLSGIVPGDHNGTPSRYTRFQRVQFYGMAGPCFHLDRAYQQPELWEVLDCEFNGNVEFWLADACHVGSVIRYTQPNGSILELRRRDQSGDYFEPRWNSSVIRR